MSTRRPRKTARQWQQLIEQHDSSGLTIAEFCEQHDVALSTFSKWHRRFKLGSAPAKSAFNPVTTTIQAADKMSVAQAPLISLQVGPDIVLTIRSADSLS